MPDKRTLRDRNPIFKKSEAAPVQKIDRTKATFYLHREDIAAIDEMQTEEFLRTGKKPERSDLVHRAIQLLRSSAV